MSPSMYRDAETAKTSTAETMITTTKQPVAASTAGIVDEEDVVSQQQQLQTSTRSSFILGELLLVVDGDVVSIYSKSNLK